MARVINQQPNPWGAMVVEGGQEPQRSDLWVVDFSSAVAGISAQLQAFTPSIPAFVAQSVALPELRVRADAYRRDSRPYNMPVFDEPIDTVRIVFTMQLGSENTSSPIYRFLDQWRAVVRAGRGAFGDEPFIWLNADYRINFAFNVNLILLKGASTRGASTSVSRGPIPPLRPPRRRTDNLFSIQQDLTTSLQMQEPESEAERRAQEEAAARSAAFVSAAVSQSVSSNSALENDLQYSGLYILKNAWLAGFKMSDLSYASTNTLVTLEAQFYVENIFDSNSIKNQR